MKEVKLDDKIVCIDNEYEHTNFPYTLEKTYQVISNDGGRSLGVINDRGYYDEPNWNRFASVKEYRKLKLEEIEKNLGEQKI